MSNGGVYIKLGQHLAALVYLLPEEYTNTLKVLQDQCPPTAMEAMERMVLADTGSTLADHFDEFDRVPLGAASLAQVHKAKLRSTGATVAVKLQHPHLDEHAPVDIRLCSWFAERVKRLFPDFEFDWLAEEVRESLPRELDFAQEAENAREVARNFRGSTVVKIPEVVWATRRILVMEFIEGAKVDNVEYMRHNNINLLDLSNELAKAFYKMIFYDGFVHCDPHPGNVFVRPVKRSAITIPFVCQLFGLPWRNYEIVLLDHGLYRRLPSSLRLDYAHLWDSILRGDEPGILKYSHRIFTRHTPHHQQQSSDGIQHHRLFASMLTGRSWRRITAGNNSLASRVSAAELQEVAEKAATGRFFQSIAEVLAKLPREVLLLLKTGDLLRAVDDSLMVDGEGGGAVVTGMYRRVGLMLVFCAVAIREKRVDGLGAWDVRVWWAWLDYWAVVGRLVALEVWLAARRVMAA
ncbi:putative aarF domain-containing protein kinase 1 [Irineochytrium annulatum]|nr:putative aarF domain-containing protein kinase 1 [Irineochytrium annulatum]